MKKQITNYTFDKTAKTITFTDYANIRLDSVLLITDVTNNKIIYNFANHAFGGSVYGNVLTLTFDTTTMSGSEELMIIYDDATITDNKIVPALDKIINGNVGVNPNGFYQYSSDSVQGYYDLSTLNIGNYYNFTVGDKIWLTSTNQWRYVKLVDSMSNIIILDAPLDNVPSYYETIYIYRKVNPQYDSNGVQSVYVTNMTGGSGSQVEVIRDRVNNINYGTQYFNYYGQVGAEIYNIDAYSELTINFGNDTGWSGSYYIDIEASTDGGQNWEPAYVRDGYGYKTSSIYNARGYTFDCANYNAFRTKCSYSTNPSHYSSIVIHGKPVGKHVQQVEMAGGLTGSLSVTQGTTPWAMGPYKSTLYSNTTNLTANQAFTTNGIYVNAFSEVLLRIATTKDSANGGLIIEQSRDNSLWDKVFVPQKILTQTAGQVFYKRIPVKMPYLRVRYTNGSVATTGTNGFNLHLFGVGEPIMDSQSDANGNQFVAGANVPTYSACSPVFTIASNPTDVWEFLGSANRDIQIMKITISGKATSATQTLDWTIRKRSTNDTGGTANPITKIPFDSTLDPATATVKNYTANPTVGTDVGPLQTEALTIPATFGKIWEIDFTQMLNAQPYNLNLATESIALNLGGVAITGLQLQVTVIFTELPL